MPYYKGQQLEIIARQQEMGSGTGHDVIVAYAETMTEGNKRQADGRHATREATEALEELPLDRLRVFMEIEIIPLIVQNPGMQTFLGTDSLSVRDTL